MALTIKLIEEPRADGHCGGAVLTVDWKLGPSDTGCVVQHIVGTFGDMTCGGTAITTPRTLEFWEAWRVVDGVVFGGTNQLIPGMGMDFFALGDRGPGSKGTNRIEGKVKFLRGFSIPPAWINGPVAAAGVLPNSLTAPARWTDDGARDHSLLVTWNCCPGMKTKPKVVGAPRPLRRRDLTDGIPPRKRLPPPEHPVAMLIYHLPAWAPQEAVPLPQIQRRLSNLRKLRAPDVRQGIVEYISHCIADHSYGVAEMSHLYLVNRYVLNVPETRSRRSMRSYGGWILPADGEGRSLAWPFVESKDGKLRLEGKFLGYLGAPCDALGEFDDFLAAFGPRWR